MADDIITRIIPQDGWSPIICHKVPIVQTISNIVGDKGPGEIYEGGRIKNFHAKIDWQDQYGGSRVPADVITESSDNYGETWTMNDLQEHEEGSFELDYEGHERDFEVRLNGTSLYIRYRWLMNGQEITDASGSLEHTIIVTDYPVKLEVDARYADNYGAHEIGEPTFNSAKVTMKSGEAKDLDEDDLTMPSEDTEWVDKDGWQSQTWSYTENGRTVTAQVGARITALRDVAIDVEINPVYTWGNEESKKYWCINNEGNDTYIFREGCVISKSDLRVTVTKNDGSTYVTQDYWLPNNYALGKSKQSITVQKGSLAKTLPVTVAYTTKVEVGNIDEESEEFVKSSFYEYGEYVEPTHYKAYYECYDGTEGFDEVEEIAEGWWNKRFVDGIKFLSTVPSKIEGGVYFYKTDYIPSEGVQEYHGNFGDSWSVDVHTSESVSSDTFEIGTIDYWEYSHYNAFIHLEQGPIYILSETPIDSNKVEGYLQTYEGDTWEKITLNIIGSPFIEGTFYYDAEFSSSHYNCDLKDNDGNYVGMISNGELCLYSSIEYMDINNIFFYFEGELSENLPEYGSDVGTLILGNKTYKYRVGLEPIDEENYLFIKDFKDKPFDYSLVKCFEPQLEEPVVEMIYPKYEDGGVYAYTVRFPELMEDTVTLFGQSGIPGWPVVSSDLSVLAVVPGEVITQFAGISADGYYLLSSSEELRKDIDVRYEDGGTSVVFIEE